MMPEKVDKIQDIRDGNSWQTQSFRLNKIGKFRKGKNRNTQ